MADFCSQCSEELFGKDYRDFAGMVESGFFPIVICEGCGVIQVDSEGRCVSEDCMMKGHKK